MPLHRITIWGEREVQNAKSTAGNKYKTSMDANIKKTTTPIRYMHLQSGLNQWPG